MSMKKVMDGCNPAYQGRKIGVKDRRMDGKG
jgi:hypothetical protein